MGFVILNAAKFATGGGSGTIGGTIAEGEVAYGVALNTIGGDSFFTRDPTTLDTLLAYGDGNVLTGVRFNSGGSSMQYQDPSLGITTNVTTSDTLARLRYRDTINHTLGKIDLVSSGNSILWNADTTDTIETSFQQNENLFGFGIPGTGIIFQDTSTSQVGFVAAYNAGGIFGAAIQAADATNDIGVSASVGGTSTSGFVADYNQTSTNQRGFIQLNANYNKLSWNFDTTDNIEATITQSQNLFGFGIPGNGMSILDSGTNDRALWFTGIAGGNYAAGGNVKNGSANAGAEFQASHTGLNFSIDGSQESHVRLEQSEAFLSYTSDGSILYKASLGDGTFLINSDADSDGYFSLDVSSGNPIINMGDISGSANGTSLELDDDTQDVTFHLDGSFIVRNFTNATDLALYINYGTREYILGDSNAQGGGTFISINDTTHLITITNVPTFADDATAIVGGLTTGQLYKTTTGGITALNIVP